MTDDTELLLEYAQRGSEAAFGELVARYVDLVHSTALRQVGGDQHLAQDVTQSVFIDLARHAGALPTAVVLGGWLYRHTGFTASKVVRSEQRRRAREQEAADMNAFATQPPANAAWRQVAPLLDQAMQRLGARDRDAIVLRYFERRDLRAVGEALGTNEDAAQKRVSRALEKLRVFLARRGITLSATVLATSLTTQAVTVAPVGLAASVAGAALAGAAGSGFSLALIKFMTMINSKATLVTTLIVLSSATTIVVQHRTNQRLKEENRGLRTETAQMDSLREETARLTQSTADADELARLRQEHLDLMRLRGEVATLRKDAREKTTALDDAQSKAARVEADARSKKLSEDTVTALGKLGLFTQNYAINNQQLCPTNFNQIREELSAVTLPKGLGMDQFEFVQYARPVPYTYPDVILLRERQARQLANGKWAKAYLRADGFAYEQITDDGNFAAWEKEHALPPKLSNQ